MLQMYTLLVLLSITLYSHATVIENSGEIKYEAESAFRTPLFPGLSCSIGDRSSNTFTTLNDQSTVVFTVNIPHDGVYPVKVQFSRCQETLEEKLGDADAVLDVAANGLFLLQTKLYSTSYSGTWVSQVDLLQLRAGLNTIAYEVVSGNVAVDFITVQGGSKLSPRGATGSYIVYEAEDSNYVGTLIGPDRTYKKIPSEASGRKAVVFTKSGDNVEFTLKQPANGFVLRYSVPDSSSGTGMSGLLGVYINGEKLQSINVTSVYSWVYGGYPYSKNPGDGNPHHFFDDVRLNFGKLYPTGTKIRFQGESALQYTIDLADFYTIPNPYPQPSGYISVTDSGADPSGIQDSYNAFNSAISKAKSQGTGVWIPSGKFLLSSHITTDHVTIRGAGPWYSVLVGKDVGVFASGSLLKLYDFALFGTTRQRIDSEISQGVGGSPGGGSIVQNLWIEHNKCGMWVDGTFDGLLVTGCTIRNTFADGINLHKGITNAIIEQTDIRNTGDDAMAMWPEQPTPYGHNTFRFNTVQLPMLANGIGIYGGDSNSITDNLILDNVNFGGGIQVGTRYNSVALAGTTDIARNTLIRTGSTGDGGNQAFGAIWLYADQLQITNPITLTDLDIQDSLGSAILFWNSPINNVVLKNITITTANFALEERNSGSASASYVVAKNLKTGGIWNCGASFKITEGPGNSGWMDVHCN